MVPLRSLERPPQISISPAFLRLNDAAAYCSLSPQMLLKLCRKGAGPPRISKGRAVLYSVRALDDWMLRDQEAA